MKDADIIGLFEWTIKLFELSGSNIEEITSIIKDHEARLRALEK